MKKLVCMIAAVLLLSGCSRTVWETVDDTDLSPHPVSQQVYGIELDPTKNMTLLDSDEAGSLYTTQNGELEIETRTFVSSDLNSAVELLSGLSADTMTVLQTDRFGLDEYQFAWVTHTEQGQRLCRADLLMDGVNCYAVVCSTLEEVGNTFEEDLRHVFATFTLEPEETV